MLPGRNSPVGVGANTMGRAIVGLGLVVVRRCFLVISMTSMTSLLMMFVDVILTSWFFRCHDAETDHPNEHANRMIW